MPTRESIVMFAAAMALAACAGAPAQAGAEPDATRPAPTGTAPHVALTATETPDSCDERRGELQSFEIESEYETDGLALRVYTPPCYAQESERGYPVLYLIHGQSFTDDQWDRLGADEAADELIRSGELTPFIIVMPFDYGSGQPEEDQFDEAMLNELLPWVEAHYRTLPGREYRAVGGLSRGASWALHFAMTQPELFGAVGGHSPPVFVEDAPKVRGWLRDIPPELVPRIWLDIGERDRPEILESARWFAALLDELDIAHEWYLFTGYHEEAYWSRHVADYLRWYAQEW